MKKDSGIYIAGHRGMVGSSLMRLLQARGYKNIITRRHSELDLTRQEAVEQFFEEERPEYIFLAAAKVGGILANNTYKADFIYENIMIAANVINSSYKYGAKKLLNLGSSCIYPKHAKQPMKEEYLLTGTLEPTNEPYAIAKIGALKLCRYYNEQYRTNFISVMPTNLYGPNDNFNLETSHVLPALIRKFHLARLLEKGALEAVKRDIQKYPLGFGIENEDNFSDDRALRDALGEIGIKKHQVILWGAGEVYREFLYADDLADACIFIMENCNFSELGEFINVGSGTDIKIKDVAKFIREVVGFNGEIKYDLSKPDGTPRKLLDISKIRGLGWEATVDLEQGIRNTYDWYCK